MLVTFTTSAYADITMFGEVAIQLLKMMGHSGTVPSALLAGDVRAARQRLEGAIAAQRSDPVPNRDADETDDDEPEVSLPQRAVPLIKLLKAAEQAEADVVWKSN